MINSGGFPINTTIEYAKELLDSGFNCAQSTLLAVSKTTGQKCESIPRIASGLGGGLGGMGEVCGAVTGCVLVIGLLYGHDNPYSHDKAEEAMPEAQTKTAEFVRRFTEANGTLRCIDILGLDISSQEGIHEFFARNLIGACHGAVSNAVQVLIDLLEEWDN